MKNVVRSLVSISLLLTSALALPTEKGFPITDLVGKDLSLYEYARQRFASRDLSKRQYGSDTYNQLTDGSGCRDISIIYARGTGMPGNVGSVEGPAWFNGLASRLGGTSRLAIQGVNYPATVSGFLAGGDAGGTTAMLNLVKDTAARCPNTKIIMGGYSQGGQLTHSSTQLMDAATASRVTAIVTFGDADRDENFGPVPMWKSKIFCHFLDNICDNGALILPTHLNYNIDASAAADFVMSKL